MTEQKTVLFRAARNPMHGHLITISGPDGVGKSTQVRLLVDHLRTLGCGARAVWFRPGYSRELDALRGFVRKLSPRPLPTATEPERRARVFERPGVSRAWLSMALADTALQFGIKLRFLLACGESVVCDRYLLDARLDLELRFPELVRQLGLAWPALAACCPRPSAAFVLKASAAQVEKRLSAKVEPFPEPFDAREVRRGAYALLERSGDAIVIDADQPPEAVHTELWARVSQLVRP